MADFQYPGATYPSSTTYPGVYTDTVPTGTVTLFQYPSGVTYPSGTTYPGIYSITSPDAITYDHFPDLTIYENALYSHLKRRRRRRW